MPMFFVSYTTAPEIESVNPFTGDVVRYRPTNPPTICTHIEADNQDMAEAVATTLAGNGEVVFVKEIVA